MASVAVPHQHRNQYHWKNKINCRRFHSFRPKDSIFSDDFSCSELWAGPAYSNSPPPSSLPIPKFPLSQQRGVSLELPAADSRALIHPGGAKSAPASPTSESSSSSTASATENLRRILNLDVVN